MNKSNLRQYIVKRRNLLTQTEILNLSARITHRVYSLDAFNRANSVMIYLNFRSEVVTDDIITHCYQIGKRVIVPVVDGRSKQLVLVEISPDSQFNLSDYGIREPIILNKNIRTLSDVDLILSPGVAFDLNGNRIGYGGGFYDKLIVSDLAMREKLKIYALAYELQIVENIKADTFDQKIDGIITEKNIYHF